MIRILLESPSWRSVAYLVGRTPSKAWSIVPTPTSASNALRRSSAKYAPELNDIEREWKTLKAHHLAHKTFKNRDDLKVEIDTDKKAINSPRKSRPLANQRISAWDVSE